MAFDWLELVLTAHREFGSRLAAVEDWNAPTPDSDWQVEHLVRHVIEEQQWVPPLLAGLTVGEATPDIVPVGDDLWTEWQKYSDAAIKAWKSTDLSAHVHLSYGTVKVEPYLRQQTSDVTIHTWDLARAVGADERLDPDLVEAVWSDLDGQRDMLAESGLFSAPVELPDDASLQDKLIALTGRDPR
ncbi:TIGR03086 family metal-binding protein [Rhodococcus sp. IEGM 1409]|uniref:TIGR03086 family metal-binding protein n=1 Tax=Rhodococcus sp. IEGM 1409 TaxID=3047082 RepID=UPI0024B6970B|nr:TIGR03086 family metal-binding protein [Rhodococcus sp. IEGM 1409]MDI9899239.1 TIGR03086 family metal-binding protein [Rhodococcus sp. IEGM 1409]